MIAPSARLISGHEAPKCERRHEQHAAILHLNGLVLLPRQNNLTPLDTQRIPGHAGTGHGAGRPTGSTPTASNPGP
jgi:hypothetical protein